MLVVSWYNTINEGEEMKKCFTINPLRTVDEVKSYYELFEKDIYQAIEIFFPYNQTKERYDEYTNSIKDLIIHLLILK